LTLSNRGCFLVIAVKDNWSQQVQQQLSNTHLTCYVLPGSSTWLYLEALFPLFRLFSKQHGVNKNVHCWPQLTGIFRLFPPGTSQTFSRQVNCFQRKYLSAPIAASVLPLAGGGCWSTDAEQWYVWLTRFRGGVGGPSGVSPTGPPISFMKRFTHNVCFDFSQNIFSYFVCSSQLVLKIWKVSICIFIKLSNTNL
jgi:hypothetical protein